MSGLSRFVVPPSLLFLLLCWGSFPHKPVAAVNFIVMQPDDFEFYEEFAPVPAHVNGGQMFTFPNYDSTPLPNIQRLQKGGLQMLQAYTASAMCGTSRFSTITGRYPSRSAFSRNRQYQDTSIPEVTIPNTKLQNIVNGLPEGHDCSSNNIAALLQTNGYHTGVTGKWHLRELGPRNQYDYGDYVAQVEQCGFDSAQGIYAENLNGFWTNNGAFSHNMEYITNYAVNFIEEAATLEKPFFLYFNPTVPHGSDDVHAALTQYSCLDTPEGVGTTEPNITGMTADYGGSCVAYRQSVLDRAADAGLPTDAVTLGSIWLDDAIGSLFQTLERTNQLDDTFFLFQLDHGQEGKGTLWEPGVRLAQFIHYPAAFAPGQTFAGLVSTIDIAPTILDYAGVRGDAIASNSLYTMDGTSWRPAVEEDNAEGAQTVWFRDHRCLFYELDQDRAVRCGCHKLLQLVRGGTTARRSNSFFGVRINSNADVLMDVCGGHQHLSVASPDATVEGTRMNDNARQLELKALVSDHMIKTDPAVMGELNFTELVDPSAPTVATASPTSQPTTIAPSVSPTSTPTVAPTTAFPTSAAPSSAAPTTSMPTPEPSRSPTDTPTSSPTFQPSTSPTGTPTHSPSLRPSYSPSRAPTSNPTRTPTSSPTDTPTASPTLRPSMDPTSPPSSSPSSPPSSAPTTLPSSSPTYHPSSSPTSPPSSSPTRVPTHSPTAQPSLRPSQSPSDLPSEWPSEFPSLFPSFLVSELPSDLPSEEPPSPAPVALTYEQIQVTCPSNAAGLIVCDPIPDDIPLCRDFCKFLASLAGYTGSNNP